jgi:hypothetical protein
MVFSDPVRAAWYCVQLIMQVRLFMFASLCLWLLCGALLDGAQTPARACDTQLREKKTESGGERRK